MAVIVVLAAAVVAAPVVLVRVIRGLGRRRSAAKSQSRVAVGDVAPTTIMPPRIAPAVDRTRSSLASSGSIHAARAEVQTAGN
jgi:hypothetical protein